MGSDIPLNLKGIKTLLLINISSPCPFFWSHLDYFDLQEPTSHPGNLEPLTTPGVWGRPESRGEQFFYSPAVSPCNLEVQTVPAENKRENTGGINQNELSVGSLVRKQPVQTCRLRLPPPHTGRFPFRLTFPNSIKETPGNAQEKQGCKPALCPLQGWCPWVTFYFSIRNFFSTEGEKCHV